MATIDVLLVGGGGGGGAANGWSFGTGGGGGGGQVVYQQNVVLPSNSYQVVVGTGGIGAQTVGPGNNGGNSTFNGLTAVGGGGGGGGGTAGKNGANGGGGQGNNSGSQAGGSGTAGYNGGNGAYTSNTEANGGGGGGAGGVGGNASAPGSAGNGGAGTANSITGSSIKYGGGGGGGCYYNAGTIGTGTDGGGNGKKPGTTENPVTAAGSGTNGRGGGGGGCGSSTASAGKGGNGGNGTVIIRYLTADFGTCTGGTKTTDGNYTVHTFTSSGTFNAIYIKKALTIARNSIKKMVGLNLPANITSLLHFNGADAATDITLDQSQTTSNNSWSLRYNTNVTAFGTAFVPSVTGYIPKVTLKLTKTGTPSGVVQVHIMADSNGLPSNVALCSSATIDCSAISTTADFDFVFSTPAILNAGTRYHIVIVGSYTVSTSNFIQVSNYYLSSGDYRPYSQEYSNSVDVWAASQTEKMYFKQYYNALIDESGKVWTAAGNAQLDTAQKKFGTASLLVDGTGDYIDTPDTADHEVAAGDFTVDYWVRFNATAALGTHFARRTNTAGAQTDFFGSFWNTDNTLHFDSIVNNVNKGRYYCSWTPATGTWYHLAFVRSGTNFFIFIDGVSQNLTVTTAISTNDLTFSLTGEKLTLGRYGDYDGFYFNGWIDEFRFSKGIARWTTGFTPPVDEYRFPAIRKLIGISNL